MDIQKFPRQTTVRTLLVDDDIRFRHYFTGLLENHLHPAIEIIPAENLQEALNLIVTTRPDIILLNLDLPDSRGLRTFYQIQQKSQEIPLIILLDTLSPHHTMDAIQDGGVSCIEKTESDSRIIICTICRTLEQNKTQRMLDDLKCQLSFANEKLIKLSLLDPLTELYNRRGLQKILSNEIDWLNHNSSESIALLLNIDGFRAINHAYGRAVGDIILKEISKKLKELRRSKDYIARIGEDEFLILLSQTPLNAGKRVAERIRLAISESPIVISAGQAIPITASLVLIPISKNIPSIDELLATAHPLLHKGKEIGKNQVLASPIGPQTTTTRSTPVPHLPSLMHATRNFYAVKQPILSLHDRQITAYEFLSRTKLSSFELPDDFFRLSKEQHLLPLIDRRCLSICLAATSGLDKRFKAHFNLFPSTIIDIPPHHILELFSAGPANRSFCIEISEQQIIGDPAYLIEAILIFKKAGIQIAIDDVGFGHSCLESLILLEPDIVKIDKKYVIGIAKNPTKCLLLKRLLKVALSLDAEVIAEGIENNDDLEILQDLGVRYGQGFLLGHPE